MQRSGKETGGYAPRGGRSGSPRLTAADLEAQARERALQRRKHHRHVLTAFYLFLFFAVLGTAAALSLTVLFRIDGVSVTGTSRYSAQQIIEASGIQNGDNLILVKTREDSQAIRQKLPYIGSVEIHRRFPSQVQIQVQAATIFGAAAYGAGYVIIGGDGIADGNGIVLETVSVPPKDCAIFHGLKIKKAQPGLPIELTDANQESIFENIMNAVQKNGIGKITSADFSQTARILLVYDGRVTINLGVPDNLSYKLDFAKSLLKNNIKETEKGTLNMSTTADTDKAYFDPTSGTTSSAVANK